MEEASGYPVLDKAWVTLHRYLSEAVETDDDVRRTVEGSGRPLRSDAASMSDDDLLAKLRGLGVNADREELAGLCEGMLSAEEVVSERMGLPDNRGEYDLDWAWICLLALWERWWPDKPCAEILDDKIQAGYAVDPHGLSGDCGRIWLDAWPYALKLYDASGVGSIREFDKRFRLTQYLGNWFGDLEMSLHNGGLDDPELHAARIGIAAEWLRRFPGEDHLTVENFRCALAESYFETGHRQKADELFREWLDSDPSWGWGWIGWADCYAPFIDGKPQDYPRAEEILRSGYAVSGVRDAADIADRLAAICENTGRVEAAAELRQQANASRKTRTSSESAPPGQARTRLSLVFCLPWVHERKRLRP